jgi:hypothetical protein
MTAEQKVDWDAELHVSVTDLADMLGPALANSVPFITALVGSQPFITALCSSPLFMAAIAGQSAATVGPTLAQGLSR